MKTDLSAYCFRPALSGDLPRLRRWLQTPEVARWWGNPRGQFELLRDDLNEPRMTMRIVSFNGRPFAYAQDYEAHAWPQPHLAYLPRGSRAIDSFIGWASMIGRGHGQAICVCSRRALRRRGAAGRNRSGDRQCSRATRLCEGGVSHRREGCDRSGPGGSDALRACARESQFGVASSVLSAPTVPGGSVRARGKLSAGRQGRALSSRFLDD